MLKSMLSRRSAMLGAAALLTGIALAHPAAAVTPEEIKARGKLIVGIQGDNPPWGFVTSAGKQDESTRRQMADLLMDQAQQLMRWKDYEFYAGDTWKATKKLTIEYGARYSLLFTPYDALNRGSSFQPFLYDPTKPKGDACNGIWVVPGTDPCTAANQVFGTNFSVAPGGPTPAARISPETPAFCRVLGHIDPTDPKAPPIRFQLNLPLQWNGRSVQYGGGGTFRDKFTEAKWGMKQQVGKVMFWRK